MMRQPPYLDWSLDRWKIGLVMVLFTGLVAASLWRDEGAAPESPALTGVVNSAGLVAVGGLTTGQVTPAQTATPGQITGSSEASRFPLTLANLGPNAIVPAGALRVLFGTAAVGSIVEVYDQLLPPVGSTMLSPGSAVDRLLGVTVADPDGLWQIELHAPLEPGQHVITLRQLDESGRITALSAPVVVTVLGGGEQGPLSLATPAIRYPYVGARLAPGRITFFGSGLPGVVIRLYVGNRLVAEGTVTTHEEWRLTPEEELAEGVYVARVLALNPLGDVIAESAPVVFVVSESARAVLPPRGPEPSVPLTVSSVTYGDRTRSAVLVRGLATPHAGVTFWQAGKPVKATNVQVDGRWQMWLPAPVASTTDVEVRSSFDERLATLAAPQLPPAALAPATPVLLSPQPGQVLTTRRPVLAGLAQPTVVVVVVVNGRVVAEVRSDLYGQWAYQVMDPLPPGATSLSAGLRDSTRAVQMATPVLVTVAPRL
jgi:hypothetical protein